MWHALKAEFVYSRPYLLGGLGIAVGVMAILSVVFFFIDDGPPSSVVAGLRGMFLIIAPLIVSFIAQSFRSEERRARLLLAGPLTPRQLAVAMVLLPAIMLGLGIVAAGLVMGVGALATGSFDPKSLNIAGFVGGQLFAYTQVALLLQEATAARRQRRQRAAVAGWASAAVAALLIATLFVAQGAGPVLVFWMVARESLTRTHLIVGFLVVAVAAMTATVQLYSGRRDFTR